MNVDWIEMGSQGVELLQAMLQIDTRNPPGNEKPAAEFVAKHLREVGLEPRFFEGQTHRTNVICRIEGTGERGPLLLTGHLDVVPVDEDRWDHDPFGGVIKDGYLYGRGAIDMKNHVVACLVMMQLLARKGIRPRRDVIFAAVADEEEGCRWGSRYLVEQHPSEVRADWMIGEVGGFTQYINGMCYYPIMIAERGRVLVRMTARGEPGHGSMPHQAMAMTRLGEALARLGKTRLPQHNTVVMERFLKILGETQAAPAKWVLPQLLNQRLSGVLLERVLPPDLAKSLGCLLANTAAPTVLSGGHKFNVIPSEVSCLLDGRILPGQTPGDLVRELRDLLGEGLEFEVVEAFHGLEQPNPESELYDFITGALRKHDPSGIPLPYLLSGFTDAQFFSRLGARCYGFAPLRFPEHHNVRFSELFHGHNERIYIEGYRWGLRVLWDV
ncbi:MAG: M20/M25/M40 family metallo-hydrolase, partial [Myxococcota bacterium]